MPLTFKKDRKLKRQHKLTLELKSSEKTFVNIYNHTYAIYIYKHYIYNGVNTV